MDAYGAADVEACVDFFSDLLSKDFAFPQDVIRRTLVCTVVLQRRAKRISTVRDGSGNGEAIDFGSVLERVVSIIHHLLDLIQEEYDDDGDDDDGDNYDELKSLHAAGNVNGLLAQVFKMHFSQEDPSQLAEMVMDKTSFE